MPAPRKWRVLETYNPRNEYISEPRLNFSIAVDRDALTPRQAGREQFKQQQHQYENMLAAKRAKGQLGSRAGKQGNYEARLAEGSLKRGRMPDTQFKPLRSRSTEETEVDMHRSATGDFASFDLRELEDTRQEIDITELVRPRKTKTKRFTSEAVRRADTITDVPFSDFERAIVESLRPEFLPNEGETDEDQDEDEWEVAEAS
ncbi:hypothetical protein FRB94_000190, partial [Tulasnella sp. JGI-2019a]